MIDLKGNSAVTVRIVTDSTSDIPPEMARKFGISIVPCYINIGEESYLDEVDITRSEFYQGLPDFSHHPKTSAPGAGLFLEAYQRLADEGVNEIISMHIHSGLSNLSNAARVASENLKHIRVTVIEIGQVALGLGFLAISAARAALEGRSVQDIIRIIRGQDDRTYVFAALDTLDYLRESGRAPGLVVGIANFLRIKPVIRLHRGILNMVSQVRTGKKGLERLVRLAKDLEPLEQIAVLHTNAVEKARGLAEMLKESFHGIQEPDIAEVTPVLGVHTGPGAVGLACVQGE